MSIFGKKNVNVVARAEGGKGGDARGRKGRGGRWRKTLQTMSNTVITESLYTGGNPESKNGEVRCCRRHGRADIWREDSRHKSGTISYSRNISGLKL